MKANLSKLGWLVVFGALLVPLAVAAQAGAPGACPGGCPGGGPGRGAGPGRHAFTQGATTQVQAEILDVERVARGAHQGVHLAVAVGAERLDVLLGPDFYVDAQPLKLAKGDRIEVKGARTTYDGRSAIVAQEVRRGDQVLTLRDANGLPAWRGQGARRR